MASNQAKTRRVKTIFKEYKSRRIALINALTEQFRRFKRRADKDDKVRLFGHKDESWEVKRPRKTVASTEAAMRGISLSRDNLENSEWLLRVAARCDSWLMSIAFYHAARLKQHRRHRLFKLINELPTVFETVSQAEEDKEEDNAEDKEEDKEEDDGEDKEEDDGEDKEEDDAQDEKGQDSD